MNLKSRVTDPRRRSALEMRAKIEGNTRKFFDSEGFTEVRTPLLVLSPGMEPHIHPMKCVHPSREGVYLHTSPEFAMKKLLAGGMDRIFQICPCFRDEPVSKTHHPEFTMLEWYRTNAGYEEIMKDVEKLFLSLAREIFKKQTISYQGKEISLAPPWPRFRVRDLFLEHAGIDLTKVPERDDLARECERLGLKPTDSDTWDDIYFKIWLDRIEHKLPDNRAVFVTRFPKSQASLSVLDQDPDGSTWAKRFEVYAGGLELGNAFEELTDSVEQRKRFKDDMELRKKLYGSSFPESPVDEEFLSALGDLPPSGGIAVGFDRMIMLFADETDIDYTLWLPSFWPEK